MNFNKSINTFIASSLKGCAVILLSAVAPVWGATITVTSLADGIAGDCTLRDAIQAANTDAAFQACTAGDAGQDTIEFMMNGVITLGSALPSLLSNITINGPGSANLIISGGGDSVINVSGTGVIISGLTVTGGNGILGGGGIYNSGTLTLDSVTINSNTTGVNGGGIYNHAAGTLSITNSTVTNNTVTVGNGAGIYNEGSIATFTGNTIASNTGASMGGGLYSNTNVTVTESTITVNTASDSGGGIHGNASVTVVDSSVTSNTATASFGGGINASTITLTRSLISGNTSGTAGGGIYAGTSTVTNSTLSSNNSDFGGAAYLGGASALSLVNSTISGNSATTEGGGIWNAGTVNFTNTIIDNNTVSNCQNPMGSGTWNSFDYNIDSANTCGLNGANDQVNTDPMLTILQDNGGFTLTHALLLGSPAIDTANNATCPTTDQRGYTRPADGDGDMTATCDVGAYEYNATDPGGGGSDPEGDFGSGGCFIATAAHGTAMAEDVRYLRAFRDQYLLTSELGKKFVNLYYDVSPSMADELRKHDSIRSVVRVLLKPLVWLSKAVVDEEVYTQQTEDQP